MGLVNRWYSIMNILETSSSISEKQLMKKLNVGKKTLKQNIELLNKELSGIAKIYYEEDYYFLKVIDMENYDGILSGKLKEDSDFNSISKRVAFIFKEITESKDPIVISDLSDSLNVSRGTVVNDVNRLREQLSSYNLSIVGKPNTGLQVEGEEYKIRLAYIDIVLDYFAVQHVTESVRKELSNRCYNLGVPKKAVNLLFRVIETVFVRINNGDFLNEEINYYQNFLTESNFFQELIAFLELEFNITLNVYERNFISYPLNIYNQGYEIDKKYDFVFVKNIFDDAFEDIQEAFAIKINKEKLFEEVRLHLIYLINRLVMRVKSQDVFINEIHLKYPLSHAMSEIFSELIANELKVAIPDVEINYLSLYFEMIISRVDKPENKEIAIVYNTGYGTSEIIKNQIEYILGPGVKITSYSLNEIDEKTLNKYFAVFSTVPLRRKDLNVPIIQLNTVFDFDDVYVRQQWEKARQKQLVDFERIQFFISKLDSDQPYKKNLGTMIDQLCAQKYVEPGFKQKILEREKMKSTIFDNGIAMPHATNNNSDKLIINVGQFDKPIESLNKKIEIVFVIGIPEDISLETENTLVNIYDFIFRIANNDRLKNELLHVDSVNEIRRIISKEVVL